VTRWGCVKRAQNAAEPIFFVKINKQVTLLGTGGKVA
jgi:hypothetical protein